MSNLLNKLQGGDRRSIALHECRPVHMGLWMVGLDNVRRRIETTCFPLIGQADRFLGAVALFWEVGDK